MTNASRTTLPSRHTPPSSRRRTSRILLALAATGLIAGGATAYAAIPGGDGAISGCHAKAGGVRYLRLIDAQAGEQCKSSEKRLTWNQKGPKGDRGPAGPAGPAGSGGSGGSTAPISRVVTVTLAPGATSSAQAHCPTGTNATGGGFDVIGASADVVAKSSEPLTLGVELVGWNATLTNRTSQSQQVNAIAICVG